MSTVTKQLIQSPSTKMITTTPPEEVSSVKQYWRTFFLKYNSVAAQGDGDRLAKNNCSTLTPPPPPAAVNTSAKQKDDFVPRCDPRMDFLMGEIQDDGDVWVERFYTNKRGRPVSYFRSVNTHRCVLLEPPTGSGCFVLWGELGRYPFLRDFATEPLDRPYKDIEKPDYKGPTYRQRCMIQQKENDVGSRSDKKKTKTTRQSSFHE